MVPHSMTHFASSLRRRPKRAHKGLHSLENRLQAHFERKECKVQAILGMEEAADGDWESTIKEDEKDVIKSRKADDRFR